VVAFSTPKSGFFEKLQLTRRLGLLNIAVVDVLVTGTLLTGPESPLLCKLCMEGVFLLAFPHATL